MNTWTSAATVNKQPASAGTLGGKGRCRLVWFSVALRPQRRVGLLGTGTEWEGDERVKGSTADTARKRPERPWTAARTMEVLRRCPLAIAQRIVHCAIAVSTAVLDRITKTMSVAPLLINNLDNSTQKTSNLLSPAPPRYSWRCCPVHRF